MLTALYDQARFLSTDNVTERIIGGDPTLQLVDVRPAVQFSTWALPGAVNIPVDSLLSPSWSEFLHQPGKEFVFYGNADILADQAWQICTRASVPDVFVMKGGLNEWYTTIIKGVEPGLTASTSELDLYSFRQSARQFFTGGGNTDTQEPGKKTGEKERQVKVTRKAPEASKGGGC
jgi:rhodanese-related sulfurtransferase